MESREKALIELLHDASGWLAGFESESTKEIERRIDDVLLASEHVADDDKGLIRAYWADESGGAA